jgi:hypothetical protein
VSVKHHVIQTAKQLLQGAGDVDADSVVEGAGDVDADSVVESIRQHQKFSTDVLNRFQVEARLVSQEYLDQKRQGKEASTQDHVMSQSAENIEACSQEGDFFKLMFVLTCFLIFCFCVSRVLIHLLVLCQCATDQRLLFKVLQYLAGVDPELRLVDFSGVSCQRMFCKRSTTHLHIICSTLTRA